MWRAGQMSGNTLYRIIGRFITLMEKTNLDLRVRRTLRNIREAFYELILEEDFHQISITELTKRADINRKTFYLHYNSLDDLVDELEREMGEKLRLNLKRIHPAIWTSPVASVSSTTSWTVVLRWSRSSCVILNTLSSMIS